MTSTHNSPALDESVSLEKLAELSAKATPGRWFWWTSNSWLRLGTDARGNDANGVPYGQDGYVAYPYVSRGDGHPDLCIRNEADRELIVAAVNNVRQQLALASRSERVEGERAAIARRIVQAMQFKEFGHRATEDGAARAPKGSLDAGEFVTTTQEIDLLQSSAEEAADAVIALLNVPAKPLSPWGKVRGPYDGPTPQIKEVTGDVLTDIALQAGGENSPAYKQAVGYQVVGSMADRFGVFNHPIVQQALDYLSDCDGATSPLPWPSEALPRFERLHRAWEAPKPYAGDAGAIEVDIGGGLLARVYNRSATQPEAAASGDVELLDVLWELTQQDDTARDARNALEARFTAIRSLASQAREQGLNEAAHLVRKRTGETRRVFTRSSLEQLEVDIRALKNTTPARSDAGNGGDA